VSSDTTEGRAVGGGGGSCRTERLHSGRTGEPFVDERLQRGERKGGPGRRPVAVTAVTKSAATCLGVTGRDRVRASSS
jgi:hypothetical protein